MAAAIATIDRFKRDLQRALENRSRTLLSGLAIATTLADLAIDDLVMPTKKSAMMFGKRNSDDEEENSKARNRAIVTEEEEAKIETIKMFFVECARDNLSSFELRERLDQFEVPKGRARENVVDLYERNGRAIIELVMKEAERENEEKRAHRFEKIEWRLSAVTSSRGLVNRFNDDRDEAAADETKRDLLFEPELRYVVRVHLRRNNDDDDDDDDCDDDDGKKVEEFECSFETLRKLSEDVERASERARDQRARRIKKYVRRPR